MVQDHLLLRVIVLIVSSGKVHRDSLKLFGFREANGPTRTWFVSHNSNSTYVRQGSGDVLAFHCAASCLAETT